jgi:siroheme synthase-like protein
MNKKEDIQNFIPDASNKLFPIFLKLEQLKVLIVGGGPVGLEKLTALINNAPAAAIHLIAIDILPAIFDIAKEYPNLTIEKRSYYERDMVNYDISIIAVNNRQLSETIFNHAKKAKILCNVADTPDLCDFYLGSIVQKGHLKIAISTNGKSPTMAKRIRQWLESVLPSEMDSLLEKLYAHRKTIKGDFEEKVKKLDELTAGMVSPRK